MSLKRSGGKLTGKNRSTFLIGDIAWQLFARAIFYQKVGWLNWSISGGQKMSSFETLGLDPAILKALEKMGFKEPSSIQAEAIPLIQQKRDLIALAHTGSGKTAACAIPLCNRVNVESKNVQALIVVPTRELELQYADGAQT